MLPRSTVQMPYDQTLLTTCPQNGEVSAQHMPPRLQGFRCLDEPLIRQIDRALCRVGSYGEVKLIVTKGQVRYIQTTQSETVIHSSARSGDVTGPEDKSTGGDSE